MNLAQLCKRAVVSIDSAMSLRDAARLMRAEHVGALVVTTESEGRRHAMGMVTDRDIAEAVAVAQTTVGDVPVGAIAARPLLSIPASADAGRAAAAMLEAGVRRLAVTDGEGAIVGLVSSDDLLAALVEPLQALALAFRAGIQPEEARPAPPPPRPVFLPIGTPGMRP